MQKAGIGAAAVPVCRRILRLERARRDNVRIKKWVDVNSPTVGVLRPSAGSRDVSAAERRRVVVFHLQLIGSGRILVNRTDLLDGIPQLVKLLEDCDDLRHQLFVHDQLATVRLAVKTDVVDANPPQLLGLANGLPAPWR